VADPRRRAREIAEECYGEVLAYCRRHAPAGHDAADLAQETFLRFVRAKGYRERGRPIAYLIRIARSVYVDASRRPLNLTDAASTQRVSESATEAINDLDELANLDF